VILAEVRWEGAPPRVATGGCLLETGFPPQECGLLANRFSEIHLEFAGDLGAPDRLDLVRTRTTRDAWWSVYVPEGYPD